MVSFVRSHGLEGVVAKKADSVYQAGLRTGVWTKTRINLGQEFVIGGYIPSHLGVDSIVIGFYKGKALHYAARVRAGFVPTTRRQVFDAIKHLKAAKCPFVNLPEKEPGRWGEGFTAEKMKEAVWLKPHASALSLRASRTPVESQGLSESPHYSRTVVEAHHSSRQEVRRTDDHRGWFLRCALAHQTSSRGARFWHNSRRGHGILSYSSGKRRSSKMTTSAFTCPSSKTLSCSSSRDPEHGDSPWHTTAAACAACPRG
jgi:ATP dependent DNA ligase C terminal region